MSLDDVTWWQVTLCQGIPEMEEEEDTINQKNEHILVSI